MPRKDPVLTKTLIVRLDPDLYATIETDAEVNERTMSQSVRYWLKRCMLEQAFK